ncbi:hypothetical protein CONCODRAFT_13610, partial [Conidiobolus coronatus NRRL 28638]
FQDYLYLNEFKEISILSKLVRLKLSAKVFHTIKLKEKSKYVNGKTERYYKVPALTKLDKLISSAEEGLDRELNAEILLSDIKSELESFNIFVSILYLKRLNFVGYQLFPIFESFSNLTVLKLYECTIPYSSFVNLVVSFPKLKSIELTSLLLIKLPKDRIDSEKTIFPPNLSCLNISIIQVTEPGCLFNLYRQLFNELEANDIHKYNFPIISMPSLKKLYINNDYDEDYDLEGFLHINPNLESLVVEKFYLDKSYKFKSLKSLSISKVYCIRNEVNFPDQEGIRELALYIEENANFNNVTKLCLSCPEVEKLHFSMQNINDYQLAFNCFLIPILAKLPKLKTLHLGINTYKSDALDITNFLHIENLAFYMTGPFILNIKFDNCDSLKSIEFNSNSFENAEYMKEFKYLFQKIINWKFKYLKRSIKGFKLL